MYLVKQNSHNRQNFFKWIWSYVHGAVGIYVEREKRERGDEREKEKELSLSRES